MTQLWNRIATMFSTMFDTKKVRQRTDEIETLKKDVVAARKDAAYSERELRRTLDKYRPSPLAKSLGAKQYG